jgi:hypothetical protein
VSAARSDVEAVDVSRRLEQVVRELEAGDGPMAARARELGRLLTELHGAGLARIVAALAAHHRAVLDDLLDDDLIASLLVLHDLHPETSQARVERALARLTRLTRVQIALVEIGPIQARVRVKADAGSAGPAPAELEPLIRDAVLGVAPELEQVHIEGVATAALVQITRLREPHRSQQPEASRP